MKFPPNFSRISLINRNFWLRSLKLPRPPAICQTSLERPSRRGFLLGYSLGEGEGEQIAYAVCVWLYLPKRQHPQQQTGSEPNLACGRELRFHKVFTAASSELDFRFAPCSCTSANLAEGCRACTTEVFTAAADSKSPLISTSPA